jgi:hypothetical protein
MIEGLITEQRVINGRTRDIIVSGKPTWGWYGVDRAQEDIDTHTLPVFKRECQHDLATDKSGLVLSRYDDAVHVTHGLSLNKSSK